MVSGFRLRIPVFVFLSISEPSRVVVGSTSSSPPGTQLPTGSTHSFSLLRAVRGEAYRLYRESEIPKMQPKSFPTLLPLAKTATLHEQDSIKGILEQWGEAEVPSCTTKTKTDSIRRIRTVTQ